MKRLTLFAVLLSVALSSCKEDIGNEITLTVASQKGTCNIVGEYSCYIVKYDGSSTWTTIPESIKGFDYQPGYEYVIRVSKKKVNNPPQDYTGEYILHEVISKVQKDSDGLPIIPNI